MKMEYKIVLISKSDNYVLEFKQKYEGLPVRMTFAKNIEDVESDLKEDNYHLTLIDLSSAEGEIKKYLRKIKIFELRTSGEAGKVIVLTNDEDETLIKKNVKEKMDCEFYSKNYVLVGLEEVLRKHAVNKPQISRTSEFESLQKRFLLKRLDEYKVIKEAIAQNNFKEIKRIAHSLKGVSNLYGFPEFFIVAKDLEYSAESLNHSGCLVLCEKYKNLVNNARSEHLL